MSSKISGLAAASSVASTDQFEINQGGVSKRATALQVKTYLEGAGLLRTVLTKSANYIVTTADSNALIIVTGADKVMTLPATAAGLLYTFSLASAGLSAGTGLSISPNASDKIMGNGFTSADNKDAILAGASDREGDSITIIGDGVDGWYIVAHEGTWAREA